MNKIEICNLKKSVGERNSSKNILSDITLTILEGEIFCIMGSSGSGKSTLLRILGGMDNISGGEVEFFGRKMSCFREGDYENHRREDVGYIFQDFNLLEGLTIKENIILPLTLNQNYKLELIEERYKKISNYLDIERFQNNMPDTVSGGEQQRAAIARAVIKYPKVVLADEPTGSLDRVNTKLFLKMIKAVNADFNTSVILVTHDTFVASNCDKVAFLEEGKIKNVLCKTDFPKNFHEEIIKIFTDTEER
ncbi:ABC transporter ATP-binding protein [Filifactor villosus]|uniref:ABC transporter ATP-binding protein n=1 Tax=Filifactor villosus TaxID=29374 RepID=A0ABV9QP71_9FIRM